MWEEGVYKMEYKKVLIIESLSVEEIHKLNIATKRCATQLKGIASDAEELLSIDDNNILKNTQKVLDKIIEKRNVFKKRAERKIEKINKTKHSLKIKFDKFTDIKRLTYILTTDIEAFKYFSPTLEEAYDNFLEFSAKIIINSKMSIEDFMNTIEKSIKTKQSVKLIEEINNRTKEFSLDK